MAMPPKKPGTKYQDWAIYHGEDLVDHDTDIKEDIRTMLLSKEIRNDIHTSVQLEIDCPSKHNDNRMPILGLNLWV